MGKDKFAAETLDPEHKIFIVHVALFSAMFLTSISLNIVYPSYRPQIVSLIAKEALTKVPNEYINFTNIFSLDLASKLFKHTGINDYTIKLVDGQQPPYGSIYSLEPVKLETLKAYIEINLVNEFIKPSKSPANTPILFD